MAEPLVVPADTSEGTDGSQLVVAPDGSRVRVPADKVEEAVKLGGRLATEREVRQEENSQDSGLEAAGLGAARGLTLGLSDVIGNRIAEKIPFHSGAYSEYASDVKEANPGASLAGEIGGNILGLAAGPVSAVTKAGTAVRAGLAARGVAPVLATAGAGAVEGGLYGLGQVISEDALGDSQTTAQKIGSITGAGLFGAGLNAFTHGLGVAGTKLVEKYGGSSLKEGLEKLSDDALMTQIGSRRVMSKRDLFGQRGDEVMKYARDNGLVTLGDTAESFADKASDQVRKVGAEMGDLLTDASEVLPTFDGKAFAAKVRSGALEQLDKLPGTEGVVNRINNDLAKLEKGQTLQEAWDFQSKLHRSLGFGEAPEAKKAIADFQKSLVNEIKDQVSAVQPGFKDAMNEVANRYSLASSLEALATDRLAATKGTGLGIRDLIAGGGFGGALGGPGGAVSGLVGSAGTKVARERGGFIVSAALNKLAKSETIEAIGKGLQNRIDTMASSGLLGKYQGVLQNASAKGINELLSTHVQLARADPVYLPTVGMEHEDAQAANDYAQKAEQLQHVAAQLKAHDEQVTDTVNRFLGQVPGRAPQIARLQASASDFKKRMDRINQVLRAPESVNLGNLAGVAPKVTTQFGMQAQAAAQFLLNKAPKNPYEGVAPAFQKPWEPSPADLEKWYRYAQAVENPVDVLRELSSNKSVPVESVEALKTVYPQLLEDMKQKTMERLAEYKKPLNYQQLRGLAQVYGAEFVNQDPKQANLLQQIHANSIAAKQPASRPDGRRNQSQEDNISTQAVRIANR